MPKLLAVLLISIVALLNVQCTATNVSTSTPVPTPAILESEPGNGVPTSTQAPIPPQNTSPTPTPVPTPTQTPTPVLTPTQTLTPTPTTTQTLTPLTLEQVIANSKPAIVRILDGDETVGTGFVYKTIENQAHIITNEHVVDGISQPSVQISDGTTYTASILGTDAIRDIAVLNICCSDTFKSLPLDFDIPDQGTRIIAIGYALGFEGDPTITQGIVSAFRFHKGYGVNVLQIDAPINPGNSGGPILTTKGKDGIVTFKFGGLEGLGFALMSEPVALRAHAFSAPATQQYQGIVFTKVAALPRLRKLDIEGPRSVIWTFIVATDFIVEITLTEPDHWLATRMIPIDRDEDTLSPRSLQLVVLEGIGCDLRANDTETSDRVKPAVPWPTVPRRMRIAVLNGGSVYSNDKFLCSFDWQFNRPGVIGIGTAATENANLSIWLPQ